MKRTIPRLASLLGILIILTPLLDLRHAYMTTNSSQPLVQDKTDDLQHSFCGTETPDPSITQAIELLIKNFKKDKQARILANTSITISVNFHVIRDDSGVG